MTEWQTKKIGAVTTESSLKYKTGSWKTSKPVIDFTKCISCMMCVAYCPENTIKVKKVSNEVKLSHVDYSYCKGCGICANVCPVKCIKMEQEEQ